MAKFDDLVMIVRHLLNRSTLAGVVSGELNVDTVDKLVALQKCEANPDKTGLILLEPTSITSVIVGSTVKIEIGTPRPGFGLLPQNFNSLLDSPKAHIKEPSQYYLIDSDYYNNDAETIIPSILAYRAVLGFIVMLKSCAAFLDEEEEVLVFIKEGKYEVPVKFTEEDLCSVNLEILSSLSCSIPNETHKEQCSSIMAEAVYEITAKIPSDRRFAFLLNQAQNLKKRFEQGYNLFAAGFSYEKIRDEVEAARVEYAGKIHKVFSDIQNQLLGIPVATIIVATQMKESTKVDSNFWISIAVLAGSFVFTLLMHFLLRNQRQTLEVIGIEIERQKGKLEKEYAAIADNFKETFKSLDSRYKTQQAVLWIIEAIVIGGFLLSIFFFYNLTQSAQQFLCAFVK